MLRLRNRFASALRKTIGESLDQLSKKKVLIMQSSATYISWIDLALGIIALKRKTNKLKKDTILKANIC